MISLVSATRNRGYTLARVARSWYAQRDVSEIIFVDDAGEDDTHECIAGISVEYPHIKTTILRNDQRRGASASRNRGAASASNDMILFCDDDEFLEPEYATKCRLALQDAGVGAVSGRRLYMAANETPEETIIRCGNGTPGKPFYRKWLCEVNDEGYAEGTVELPFTNANILTWTELVRKFGFDPHYFEGSAYREETDYQMNLFTHGYRILMLSNVHSLHLDFEFVRSGGARIAANRKHFEMVKWSIIYTDYFYRKYWSAYAQSMGIYAPRIVGTLVFACFSAWRTLLKPNFYRYRNRFFK